MSAEPHADHPRAPGLDGWTIAALAIVAYTLADLLHEGGGHGGACLLVGGHPKMLTTAYFDCGDLEATSAGGRWMAAGGSIANVLVGVPLLALAARVRAPSLRLFVWLLATMNLLTSFGYLLYSGIGGIGDWTAVIEGVPHQLVWRIVEIVAGAGLYFYVAPRILWPVLAPFVGAGPDRERRARTLTLVPYLAGGTAAAIAGALNPLGVEIMLISSIAAAFGGNSLLAWFFPIRAARVPPGAPAAIGIARGRAWFAAAAVALAIFVGIFGRGVAF